MMKTRPPTWAFNTNLFGKTEFSSISFSFKWSFSFHLPKESFSLSIMYISYLAETYKYFVVRKVSYQRWFRLLSWTLSLSMYAPCKFSTSVAASAVKNISCVYFQFLMFWMLHLRIFSQSLVFFFVYPLFVRNTALIILSIIIVIIVFLSKADEENTK